MSLVLVGVIGLVVGAVAGGWIVYHNMKTAQKLAAAASAVGSAVKQA